jgi:hypothetical protein
MDGFFDYAIADEVHELKGGDTAQGNALGTLAASARHIAVLTGTLLGGYAQVFGVRAVETSTSEMEAQPAERDLPEVIIPPPSPIPALVTQLLMFGGSLESVPRPKPSRRPSSGATTADRLGLFQSQR